MASELLVKRLLKQAGVSVLAGLLLSSAVMAEGNADAAGANDDGEVSVGIEDGGPDVSIDPVDPGDWAGEDGELGDPADGFEDGVEDGGGEWTGGEDGAVDDGAVDDGATGGDDGAVDDGWTGGDDPISGCIECSGVPDIAIDPREMDGTFNDEGTGEVDGGEGTGEVNTMADGPIRGTEPNHRGNVSLVNERGEKAARNQGDGEGQKTFFWWKKRAAVE